MFHRRQRDIPQLNTTSTADISFMLLIFFLVTSSMDTDKGLARQLAPLEDQTQEQPMVVRQRNVMQLRLDSLSQLTCDGEQVEPAELTRRVEEFVDNRADDPAKPEMSLREVHLLGRIRVSDRHVIFVEAHRQASYNAYFEMQNAVVAAYNSLRDRLARERFGHSYNECTREEHDALALVYPQRISEQMLGSE